MNTLTIQRGEDGVLRPLGEIPELIYIADELLGPASNASGVEVYGSNVLFKTEPALRYVIQGRSTRPEHMEHCIWIAERVEEFES